MAKPQVTVLKNGLTVITQHVPGEQVYANVAVNVGFRHERNDQNHMTHFLEHMAASETLDLSVAERDRYISDRRGTSNASTNSERTDYHLQVGKEFTEDAVKLLADGFLRPKFEDKNVDVERKAVAEEMRSHAHDQNWINRQHLFEAAFPDTQLDHGWAKVTEEVLQNHTTQALKDFKAIHYTADNMALAVVGEVKHEDVVAWAEKHFAGLAPTTDTSRAAPPAVYRGGFRKHENAEAEQVNFIIGFEGSGRKDPQTAAVDQVLSHVLGGYGDKSSRLYQAIIENKQIASSIYAATSFTYHDNGIFNISGTTTADQAKDVVKTVSEEVNKLLADVSEKELDRVKNRMVGYGERSVEDIEDIGSELSFTQAVDGKVYDLDADLALIKSVTVDQIKARIKEIFQSPPAVAVHGNGLEQFPSYEEISAAFGKERHLDERGLVIQTEQEKASALARATAAGKEAPVSQAAPVEVDGAPQATEPTAAPEVTVLENGLKIVTQKAPTKQIFAELSVGVGSRHEKPSEAGISGIVANTSNIASQRLDVAQKAEAVANLRGAFSVTPALETTDFGIRAANEFTGEALQLLAESVTQPRFDAESVKKQQTLRQKQVQSQKLDPQTNTSTQLRRVAFPGTGLDTDLLGNVERIGKHSHAEITAFKDQHYTADNMVLSVVGDVDHAEIVKLAKQQFAGLKAHPDTPREPLTQPKYRGGQEIRTSEASDQVTLRIGFKGNSREDEKASAVDQVLSGILGGGFSSRLMSSLRSDKGLVYYAQSFNSNFQDTGLFTIVAGTNQDKLEKTVDAIATEVRRFAASLTQEEVDSMKNDILGKYERELASPETVGSILASKVADGKSPDIQKDIQNLKEVTLEEIQARAAEIFASAPSVAAYGKGADRIPPYEEISEKFGKRRSLDASGLVTEETPAQSRGLKGASVAAQPEAEKQRAIG